MSSASRIPHATQRLLAVVLTLCFAAASFFWHRTELPMDFYALFLAAHNYGLGAFDQVYAEARTAFDLAVPTAWPAQAEAFNIADTQLYPYIYPPIWAAVAAELFGAAAPQTLAQIAYVINPLLLGAGVWLAHRIMRPQMGILTWQALALGFLAFTSIGSIALFQNQPQILVSVLILLALERDRSDAPIAAGLAMALAASIKLYPALFALLWFATRNHRALGSFVVFGGALGGASIAIAGWPLHQAFLTQIDVIAHSLFTCSICFNLNAALSQIYFADHLAYVAEQARAGVEVGNIFFSSKPPVIAMVDRVALLVVLFLSYRALRAASRTQQFQQVWPCILIAVSFVSPLTWTYHYLTVAVFTPFVIEAYGRAGRVHFAVLFGLFSIMAVVYLDQIRTFFLIPQAVGTLGILYLFALFLRPRLSRSTAPAAVSA